MRKGNKKNVGVPRKENKEVLGNYKRIRGKNLKCLSSGFSKWVNNDSDHQPKQVRNRRFVDKALRKELF